MFHALPASASHGANNTPGLAPRAQLPQNIEAEQSVLAACLLNGEVTEEAVMRLRPENFFRPAHRIIFEAIISLTNRHIPVDPIALADTLKSTGQLEAVGGRAYLAELADNTFSLTSWERHVDIVKRQSILRELVFAATQINALAYDAPDDLDQVVEEAEKTLFNVTEKTRQLVVPQDGRVGKRRLRGNFPSRQPEGQDGRRSHGLQGRR